MGPQSAPMQVMSKILLLMKMIEVIIINKMSHFENNFKKLTERGSLN